MWGSNKTGDLYLLRLACIFLVGAAPALMAILPWDFGNDFGQYRVIMRGHSLVVPLLQCLIVLIVMAGGFSPYNSIRALPGLSKVGACLFCVIAAVGAFTVAKSPILVAVGMFKISIHALFFLAVIDQVENWRRRELMCFWFAISLGLLVFWFVWITNIWIFEPNGRDWVRLIPGVTNVRGLGFFAVAGFFAGMALAAKNKFQEWQSPVFVLGVLVSVSALIMVLWTGSRGGLLAIMSGAGFIFVFAPALRKSVAVYFGLALILALAASYPLPIVNESYGLERIILSSSTISDGANPSSGRTQMWAGTVQKIMDRPMLGWGIEQFAISGPEETLGFKQPHNMILQILFSIGFLGGLATLMILLPIASRVVFDISQPESVAAWGYVTGVIVFGLYDAAFYYPYPVMIFLIAAAIILTSEKPLIAPDRSS